jgi:mitogen-activated protein kinase kinase
MCMRLGWDLDDTNQPGSSLDRISKDFGPVRVDVLGKIAESVLGGLVYLYEAHRIMHRDIKPSNVLVNSRGSIKLCDFGVAGETVNSIANTFVGTSTYMAPERIQGGAYTVKSDVWSVGLTIMELAVGRFPFDQNDKEAGERTTAGPLGILDLLQTIVHEPAPKLPKSDAFPPILDEFIAKCLLKNPDERPTPRQLFVSNSSNAIRPSSYILTSGIYRTRMLSFKPPNGRPLIFKSGLSA